MKKLTKHELRGRSCAALDSCLLTKLLLLLLLHVATFMPVFSQSANTITVSGVVKDSVGAVIPNATVLEKGTKNAVTTKLDGAFTIKVSGQSAVLIISSVGYVSQESPVGAQTEFSIQLKKAPNDLSEVIVVGYGTTKKASVIGAIAAVTDKDISMVHGGSTVSSSLAGKITGV